MLPLMASTTPNGTRCLQCSMIEALANGRDDMEMMREQYRLRRNFIVKSLNEIGLKCHLPVGSFYSFPSIASTGLSAREFAVQLLEQERVALVPGNAFGPGGEGHVRASFCSAMPDIEKAVERSAKFVKR